MVLSKVADLIGYCHRHQLYQIRQTMPENFTTSASNWHHLAIDDVFSLCDATANGLSQAAAEERLRRFGPNSLKPQKKRSAIARLGSQFHNVLIYVLLAASMMTMLLQHWVDSGVIIAVVILNALIGFIQEGKAEKALDAIRDLLSHTAAVKRDGKICVIPTERLVPGDIVVLKSGDKVPADIRLLQTKNLRIDEAMLTGESVPVEKNTDLVADNADLGDRTNMAYSGTLVTYGQGNGVIIATGDNTELGRISTLLGHVQTLVTPLLRQLARFGTWLTIGIITIAAITFLFGILIRDYTAPEMFLAAVGLAVAAIPEGLPAIMTITLAIGVQRMAQRNAIIRRLPAVETLGEVSVVCSDKTGTLTRNEMTVQSVSTFSGLFSVSGVGYDPHGGFQMNNKEVDPEAHSVLMEICKAASLCNDADVENIDGQWRLNGEPTEGALISLALKAGLDLTLQRQEWPRTDIIPFESEHKFMATLHHDHAGHGFIYIKGAPERILEMCTQQRMRGDTAPIDHYYWQQIMETMAGMGQRLLAIAFKPMLEHKLELTFKDTESNLTLLGVVGIMDPPRDEAIVGVAQCRSAGIRVKMITGDHATTAKAIATKMGISESSRVLTGHEIDNMNDEQLANAIEHIDIFARTTPEHKLQLVEALQANGHIVAMTGDGVNDAPALKRADVGVAMGRKGTEVSKEASEMILTDDNFASIVNAVEEGRTVYDNLKKAILFILPTNGGEAFMLITAIILGRALPITPVQILWVNMITAVTLALTLAFEPPEPKVMRRPPRNPAVPMLSPILIWRIVFVSAIIVLGTFGLFIWHREQGADISTARTIAVNTLVLFEIFYLFNTRFITESIWSRQGLFGNKYVYWAIGALITFQLLFTYFEPAQMLFKTTSLDPGIWLQMILVSSSVLFAVEAEKYLFRKFGNNRFQS